MCYANLMTSTLTWTSTHKPLNQDAVASSCYCVCIADGVTPLNTTQGDNKAMLTHVFAHALTTLIARNATDPHTVRDAFATCLMEAQLMVDTEGIQSTVSFVTWDKSTVSIACLGDSPAYVVFKNGTVEKVADPVFKGAGTEILKHVIKRVEAGKSWKKSYKKAKAELLKTGKLATPSMGHGLLIVRHRQRLSRNISMLKSLTGKTLMLLFFSQMERKFSTTHSKSSHLKNCSTWTIPTYSTSYTLRLLNSKRKTKNAQSTQDFRSWTMRRTLE